MRTCLSFVVAVAAVCEFTGALAPVQAQPPGATLVMADGVLFLDEKSVEPNTTPLVLPDVAVLRTADSRAAVALKRGGWLFLDARSSVRVHGNGVYNFNRLEILSGSAIIASETSAPLVDCESEVRLSSAGLFRFDVRSGDTTGERPCRVRVYEGAAAVPLMTVTNALRAGQSMMCNRRCGDMIPTTEFSPAELDGFDQWARRAQQQLKK
jgi:ferric-dicitrate binding protein FerR (iron transport regulator)